MLEDLEADGVLALAADVLLEPGHGLQVVVEDLGTGREDACRWRRGRRRSPGSGPRSWPRSGHGRPGCIWRKWSAPPSARSSRVTEVITTCFRPSRAQASARRSGSSRATGSGWPRWTAQKPQGRVQTSPRTMNVAVRRVQHSERLGQRPLSQIVSRPELGHQVLGEVRPPRRGNRPLEPLGQPATRRGGRGRGRHLQAHDRQGRGSFIPSFERRHGNAVSGGSRDGWYRRGAAGARRPLRAGGSGPRAPGPWGRAAAGGPPSTSAGSGTEPGARARLVDQARTASRNGPTFRVRPW